MFTPRLFKMKMLDLRVLILRRVLPIFAFLGGCFRLAETGCFRLMGAALGRGLFLGGCFKSAEAGCFRLTRTGCFRLMGAGRFRLAEGILGRGLPGFAFLGGRFKSAAEGCFRSAGAGRFKSAEEALDGQKEPFMSMRPQIALRGEG